MLHFRLKQHNVDHEKLFTVLSKDKENVEIFKVLNENGYLKYFEQDIFGLCCENGNICVAKYMYSLEKVDAHYNEDYAFRISCEYGKFDMAKQLFQNLKKINIHALDDYAFRYSCKNGHLDIAKWLYQLGEKINVHAVKDYAFRYACSNNHLNVCKWLYQLGDIDIHMHENFPLVSSCELGGYETARWLYSLFSEKKDCIIDLPEKCYALYGLSYVKKLGQAKWIYSIFGNYIDINKLFTQTCRNGASLDIIKYVYSLRNEQIDIPFLLICKIGRLDVVKWLYSLGKVDIHIENDIDIAFAYSCENGHFDLAKYLYSLGDVDIHTHENYAFDYSCANGYIEIAKWLYSLSNQTLYLYDDSAFHFACAHGFLEIAKWLYSIDYHDEDNLDNVFIDSVECGELEVIKWMFSIDDYIMVLTDALEKAIILGDLSLSQYLYYKDEYTNNKTIDKLFMISCEYGHYSMARWLYSLNKTKIDNTLFITSCKITESKIPIWLYSICSCDIDINVAFRKSCMAGNIDVAYFLHSLGINFPNYDGILGTCLLMGNYGFAKQILLWEEKKCKYNSNIVIDIYPFDEESFVWLNKIKKINFNDALFDENDQEYCYVFTDILFENGIKLDMVNKASHNRFRKKLYKLVSNEMGKYMCDDLNEWVTSYIC